MEGRRGTNRSAKLALFSCILAIAVVVRIYVVVAFPPVTDVYYYDTQAAKLILQGVSPYGHSFAGIPPSLATPGAQDVFAYLPFTAIYFVPFYLLGDVRFGAIAADVIIGLCLFQFSKRWSMVAAAIFLLIPFSTYYMNDALPAIALVAVSIALESRGKGALSSLALGVALATSVTTWLVLPFYLYRRARSHDLRGILFSFATFAAISLPFFAANPEGFVYDVLLFQFGRPTPGLVTQAGTLGVSLNPSLSGVLVTMTGQQAPLYLRVSIVLVVLSLCLLMRTSVKGKVEESSGKGSLPASTLRASLFVAAAVLVLPSVFFFVYAELPLVLILSWLALRGGPDVATVR